MILLHINISLPLFTLSLKISKYKLIKYFLTVAFSVYYSFIFREKKGGKKRERKVNLWLPLVYPLLGIWPTTQAFALDWESNWWPLVHRLAFNALCHSSQGRTLTSNNKRFILRYDSAGNLATLKLLFLQSVSPFYLQEPEGKTGDKDSKLWAEKFGRVEGKTCHHVSFQ